MTPEALTAWIEKERPRLERALVNKREMAQSTNAEIRMGGETFVRKYERDLALLAWAEKGRLLQAFKDYVHRRLDEAGVPTHPDGPHSKEGCRIGDRLDLLIGARDEAQRIASAHAKGV